MKRLMLICAPVTSRSGYGAHARDLVSSFIEHDKYEVKILDVPWGNCPRNALDKNNVGDKKIIDCILKQPKTDRQPDIYVDIRIPDEFERFGKFNIGITAGVETTAVSGKWLECCNKMDLIIVPSEHSKQGFVQSIYDKLQQLPNGQQQKIGEHRLEKPIEVLFEGADDNIYKPIEKCSLDLVDDIKEDFCFLSVGQWTKGNYGEDRKDISRTLKVFYETFANKKNQPALILKTSGATFSIMDREDCLAKINHVKNLFPSDWNLPNVYLLHGSLSNEEMNKLYNHPKVKSFVSLTHGEGFGRPLLEATMVGLPVIASGWSGQMDFLSEQDSILLGGELSQIPKSVVWKDILIPESSWFIADEQGSSRALTYCFENYDEIKQKALNLMNINRDKFTLNKMSKALDELMGSYESQMGPAEAKLKLPKLKKVTNSDTSEIKLPKLSKEMV